MTDRSSSTQLLVNPILYQIQRMGDNNLYRDHLVAKQNNLIVVYIIMYIFKIRSFLREVLRHDGSTSSGSGCGGGS